MSAGTATAGRVDRDRVLQMALQLIDEEGIDAVTMRRLGSELDVDPMTIHHHAGGKDRLLDGVGELLWAELDDPPAGGDPATTLRTLAWSARDLFHRHPDAAPLMLRCSAFSRAHLEVFRAYLDALAAGGLSQPATVLRPVLSYALGSGHAEVTMPGAGDRPASRPDPSEREMLIALGQALPDDVPAALADAAVAMIVDCDPDRCFAEGLELMLAGMTAAPSRSTTEDGQAG